MTPIQRASTWLDFKRNLPMVPEKQQDTLINFMLDELKFKGNFIIYLKLNDD